MIADTLLNGVAVIIDDHINDDEITDLIGNIKSQIQEKNIPILGYSEIPEEDEIKHFSNAGFVIIDWKLNSIGEEAILSGTTKGSELEESEENQVAEFIFKLKEHYFGPVFIFSKESIDTITKALKQKFQETGGDSQCEDLMDYIFINDKKEFVDNKLFDVIDSWFQKKPSIYVIKKWDETLIKSKRNLFWHLYELNHNWPQIFWKVFKDDNTDPSIELRDLLSRNLLSRLEVCKFDEDCIGKMEEPINHNDIRKVLRGEKFIQSSFLQSDSIACGDIFYMKSDTSKNKYYYINIRPSCDCIQRDSKKSFADINMYMIRGQTCSDEKLKDIYNLKHHNFDENNTFTILPFIKHNGKEIVIRFNFNDLFIKKFGDCKEYRIGRLLPPYITHIKQKYAAHLQREGLVPTPENAMPPKEESIEKSEEGAA